MQFLESARHEHKTKGRHYDVKAMKTDPLLCSHWMTLTKPQTKPTSNSRPSDPRQNKQWEQRHDRGASDQLRAQFERKSGLNSKHAYESSRYNEPRREMRQHGRRRSYETAKDTQTQKHAGKPLLSQQKDTHMRQWEDTLTH